MAEKFKDISNIVYKNVGSKRLIFVLDFKQIWQHIFYQVYSKLIFNSK